MRRLGVWFNDGTVMTVARVIGKRKRTDEQMKDEIRDVLEGANRGVKPPTRLAKMIEFDLPDEAIREIK